MVRCDSGKEGNAARVRVADDEWRLEEDSAATGESVSSCGGTVGVMIGVNYAKYES